MAKSDPCPKCGLNMNMVGKAHRCVARSGVATSAKTVALVGRVAAAAGPVDPLRVLGGRKGPTKRPSAVKSSEPAPPVTKGRGRPPGPKRVPVLLEIEPELLARLDRYHEKSDLASRQAVIRFLLDGALK